MSIIPPIAEADAGVTVKRRVAAYCRVSTLSEEQETSLVAQQDYYYKYIMGREDWEFVNIYYDDGISGLSFHNREGFNRMIEDALAGRIDLIITKSLSRFARNTVDTLVIIRKLKAKNIEVYFQKEDIYTLDSKGEFLITLMSSLAQEESRSMSENITWGHRKRFADGIYHMPYSHFLGYDKGPDGTPIINQEQAEVVRLIYLLFLLGNTAYAICSYLKEQGIHTPSGDDKWSASTVHSILKNEKYKGDALLQKTFVTDFLTKRQKKNEGEVPQYYVTGGHEAIVSSATFDLVQEEIERRKVIERRYSCTSAYTTVLKCAYCGTLYGRKILHSNDKYRAAFWRCSRFYDGNQHSPTIRESILDEGWLGALHWLVSHYCIVQICMEILAETLPEFSSEDAIDAILTVWDSATDDHIDGILIRALTDSIIVEEDRSLDFQFIDGCNYRFNCMTVEEPGFPRPMPSKGGSRVMTLENRELVKNMRLAGMGYKAIANETGINRDTVKSYCFRHGLSGSGSELAKEAGNICKNCGKPIEQNPKRKKKLFCGDNCRYAYWKTIRKQKKKESEV